jgi:hypothetical protein
MYHGVTQVAEGPRRDGRDPSSTPVERGERESRPPREESAPDASASGDSNRKERVLHTRVPAVLERELKRFADNLRIPVSNLVRTILEDALDAADAATMNVEGRLKKAAEQLEHERERFKKRVDFLDPLTDVFAFQEVTLAQPARCVKCAAELRPGEKAHMGLTEAPPRAGARRIFACGSCLPK